MGPDVFMDDFERTEWSDGYFGMIGRLLVFATRFEVSVRGLSTLLDLKATLDALESPERLEELLDAARKRNLARHIDRLGLGDGEISEVFRLAREARNEVAHELGRGLDCCLDRLRKTRMVNFEEQLIDLAHALARGDRLACLMISILTKEHIPTGTFLNDYPEIVAHWVIER